MRAKQEMNRIGIMAKVHFLCRPESYVQPTSSIEIKETHMSYVFLTNAHAWKLKKPVRTEFIDLTSAALRRENCEAEVRLNRRLAQDVYLDVVPLTLDPHGNMHLAGVGESIDWLVQMRRLPANRMLDYAIAHRTVSDLEIRKVGKLLAGFYRGTPPEKMAAAEYNERLAAAVSDIQLELSKPEYELPTKLVDSTATAQLRFIRQRASLLAERVSTGKIIEGHGDLRPEHVCLESNPVIIDCLEFNRELRILDAVSDIAFLMLECDRLNAVQIGDLVLQTYRQETGDAAPDKLVNFYKSLHASQRAKISVWHLKDHEITDRKKWIDRSKSYLEYAKALGDEE